MCTDNKVAEPERVRLVQQTCDNLTFSGTIQPSLWNRHYCEWPLQDKPLYIEILIDHDSTISVFRYTFLISIYTHNGNHVCFSLVMMQNILPILLAKSRSQTPSCSEELRSIKEKKIQPKKFQNKLIENLTLFSSKETEKDNFKLQICHPSVSQLRSDLNDQC